MYAETTSIYALLLVLVETLEDFLERQMTTTVI